MARKTKIEAWTLEETIVLIVLLKRKIGFKKISSALQRSVRDIKWQVMRMQKFQTMEDLFAHFEATYRGQAQVEEIFTQWVKKSTEHVA